MRRSAFRFLLLVLLPVLVLALAGPLSAQGGVTDDEVNEVAKDLYCPVCESTPLDVCPTQACADWRELIRTQLSEGASKQDVLEYFARQYGDGVLANPPRRGVSLVVLWVLPVLGILLGLLLFGRLLRSLRQAPAGRNGAAPITVEGSGTATVAGPPAAAQTPRRSKSTPAGLEDYIARVEQEVQD